MTRNDMKTILQINTTLNYGSTGRIAEQIGLTAEENGWRSYLAHGPKGINPSSQKSIGVSSYLEGRVHSYLYSLLLDSQGLGSRNATKRFIETVDRDIRPDIVHLHNIHGNYINYEVLFRYLKDAGVPVVWTLHDCWSFTGHCCYFDRIGCDRWKTLCRDCPSRKDYPTSYLLDNSSNNHKRKRELFTSIKDNLTLVPVSEWLGRLVRESFFNDTDQEVIHNGIDTGVFKPSDERRNHEVRGRYGLAGKKVVLGVASPWSYRKGFDDFMKLAGMLSDDYAVVMVGLSEEQIQALPDNVVGIRKTQNTCELAELYSCSDVLVNPTYEDNYPTVNLEAISCGTPVITYETGGSPESVTPATGMVVPQGDVAALADAIEAVVSGHAGPQVCREYAMEHFDSRQCFNRYINLYDKVLSSKL